MISTATRYVVLFCLTLIAASSFAAEDSVALYNKTCAGCHAADGSGNTPARKKMSVVDLREKTYVAMSDADMFDTIGRGTKHKEYPHSYLLTGMSEQQVQSLVAYIRTLQKKAK